MKKNHPRDIYVLGLNEGLCASAALLKNGEIIAAVSEERFTSIKNQWGFPKKAIDFCCKFAGINPSDLDLVVLSYIDPYTHFTKGRAVERGELAPSWLIKLRNLAPFLEYRYSYLSIFSDFLRKVYYLIYQPKNQAIQVKEIADYLKIPEEKIIRMNHHLAHAYTTFYSNSNRDNPSLVLTCDGAGDQDCASVYLVRNNSFKLLKSTPHTHSLGLLYSSITNFLGLRAHEDEYKVMGLAPYSENSDFSNILDSLKSLIWVEGLRFNSKVFSRHFNFFIRDNLMYQRFDKLASAIQKLLEELLVKWVLNAVSKTKTKSISFGGGVFQNVKANQKILEQSIIKNAFFMPSPGDETNCIGACFFGYQTLCKKEKIKFNPLAIKNMYLGPDFSEEEILKVLKKYPKLKYKKSAKNFELAAKLIEKGEIIARFSGRMEMGARGLGNRSIIADPRNINTIEKINKMIKVRDFWMPFAPTILKDKSDLYIKNPRKIASPFMILAFDTTEKGRKDLAAAIHPGDKTTRPQILTKEENPKYYQLIEEFGKLTGVYALLNTSFNIHGKPIVATPEDALYTLTHSGLKFLIMEDFLISK